MPLTQKEVKNWCQKFGYSFEKIKGKDTEPSIYRWTKPGTDPLVTDSHTNLREAYLQMYNHMTDYKWVQYQKEYKERIDKGEIDYDNGIY
jgi:hypothetical protein